MARRPSFLTVLLIACAASCGDNQVQPSDITRPGDDISSSLLALTDQPWSALTANGWRYLRRESAKEADIVTDATAPMSPPNVLRITFTPAMPPDTEPTVHWIRLPNSTEVSAAWWIKLSPNWKGSEICCGKMTFLFPEDANGDGLIYSNIGGTDTARYVNVATTWSSTGYRFWEPNAARTHIKDGEWHRIEWYVKWESRRGANDGVIRWKVNGVVNGDYRNVPFPSVRGFSEFQHAPTQHRLPAGEQYMYIDHTTIAQATER